MCEIITKYVDLARPICQDCVVLTTILEMCPEHGQRGRMEVQDEIGEDCNAHEILKHYRIQQQSSEAQKCDCGQVLRPVVD